MIKISLFTLSVCEGKTFVSYDVEVLMHTGSVVTVFLLTISLKKWKGSLPQFNQPLRKVGQ